MSACSYPPDSCDCADPVEPGTGSAYLTAGASRVLGVRVTKGFARELARACSASGCSQSDLIRLALAKLAKKSADPDQQYAALLDLLGIDPTTATTSQIEDAIVAILEAHPPEGDAPAEPADPTASAADAPPPPLAASKLSPQQAEALARRGLPQTQAAWSALTRSMLSAAERKPTRTPSPTAALSKPDVAAMIAGLSPDIRVAALKKFASLEEFVIERASVLKRPR